MLVRSEMENNYKRLVEEFEFCLRLWEEKGGCGFGSGTRCPECGVPYLLWKLISGEVLDKGEKLSLEEWKEKLLDFKNS